MSAITSLTPCAVQLWSHALSPATDLYETEMEAAEKTYFSEIAVQAMGVSVCWPRLIPQTQRENQVPGTSPLLRMCFGGDFATAWQHLPNYLQYVCAVFLTA